MADRVDTTRIVDKVLLYSGGMDSVMLEFLEEPELCVYVNTRARYSDREIKYLLPPVHGRLIVDNSVNLDRWELSNTVVPQRNAFLALIGAYYGNRILLGATMGDVYVSDTLPRFAELFTKSLQFMWTEQYWTPHREVRLEFPAKDDTKIDLLNRYLSAGGSVQRIVEGISCYSKESKFHCGLCIACARKWVALRSCNIQCSDLFDEHPSKFFTDELISKMKLNQWRGEREDQQTLEVLDACNS